MSSWWGGSSKEVEASKPVIHVTASNSYDQANAQTVPINTEKPIIISSKTADVELLIRIKDFLGSQKHAASPKTSPYFTKRKDTNISIQISLTPKEDFYGNELLFGNDFGYPIKEFLPYGTSTGLKLFKKYVDPSVNGDLLIDEPYLYGKALSSFNVISASPITSEKKEDEDGVYKYFEEDLTDEAGDLPGDPVTRQKFFQDSANLKSHTFIKGKTYNFDFFSGLVSLQNSEFHINLPGGYSLNLSNYLNDKFNKVRYVLKRDDSEEQGVDFGDPILIINFQLVEPDKTESIIASEDGAKNTNENDKELDLEVE